MVTHFATIFLQCYNVTVFQQFIRGQKVFTQCRDKNDIRQANLNKLGSSVDCGLDGSMACHR